MINFNLNLKDILVIVLFIYDKIVLNCYNLVFSVLFLFYFIWKIGFLII